MKNAPIRAYAAEAVEAFLLTSVVLKFAGTDLAIVTPLFAAFTLSMAVYLFGGISGAHVNPAITIAQWSIGKIRTVDAVPYIAAQIVGAALAYALAWALLSDLPVATFDDAFPAMAMEAVGAAILSMGVCAVVYGKVSQGAAGMTVGGSLLVGIIVAVGGSQGILNPAVAVGLRAFGVTYLVAPVVGAVIGAWLFRWLAGVPMRAAKA
jgi:glycerol uptake facilitator protein